MKNLLFLMLCFSQMLFAQEKQPVDYVNPFIGSSNFGATNPGAVVPRGMASVVPFNVSGHESNAINQDAGWCSTPYVYENEFFTGFSHINFSSVGCPDLGSIILMPTSGEPQVFHADYGTGISEQSAKPGYYSCMLNKYHIKAEMTATQRSGLSSYTFPEGESNILLNLGLGLTNETGAMLKIVSKTEVVGYKMMGTFCYNPQAVYPVYFVVRFDKPAEKLQYWKKHDALPGLRGEWCSTSGNYKLYQQYKKEMSGDDIGLIYSRKTAEGERIQVQVGLSFISIENARANLEAEQDGFNFEQVMTTASKKWNDLLSEILVEGGSEDQKTMFYTAFYHTLLHPNVFQDHNGDYVAMGSGDISNSGDQNRFTMFSLWDTYRVYHPLMSVLFPADQENMVRSMLGMYRESGWLPKWEYAGQEFHVMEGDPALAVISDTYLRGLDGFDIDLAYQAMMKHVNTPGKENKIRRDNDFYLEHGFVPITRDFDNSVSQAVEYYIADYCFGQFAKALGMNNIYQRMDKQSKSFSKYFDESHGLLRPLRENGEFMKGFDPLMGQNFEPSHGFHEGTSWNYSFSLPHAIPELIKLHGGKKVFVERLVQCFEDSLFDMSNEPDIGYPYYFNYVKGEEWRTDKYVKDCIDSYFFNSPGGIPGNDDAGTLSAWLMFSMMGFYPNSPGKAEFTLSIPVFDRVKIKLDQRYYPEGQLIIQKHPGKSETLKKIKLNNKSVSSRFVSHQDLMNGKTLDFYLR